MTSKGKVIHEGYQPEIRGYTPKPTTQTSNIKAPQGGSGVSTVNKKDGK